MPVVFFDYSNTFSRLSRPKKDEGTRRVNDAFSAVSTRPSSVPCLQRPLTGFLFFSLSFSLCPAWRSLLPASGKSLGERVLLR